MNINRATSTGIEHNPRKRGRTACTRCKTRKQKCDNEYPSCTNCRNSGVECDKRLVSVAADNDPGYTQALEERVAYLEGKLLELTTRERENVPVSRDDATGILHPISAASQQQTPGNGQVDTNTGTLGEITGFLSLNSSESPAYIGSSSGLSLAVNLGEMVRATVMTKAFPDSTSGRTNQTSEDNAASSDSISSSHKAISMDDLLKHRADPPNDEMGAYILDAYTGRVQFRYPFLDRDEILRLHQDRWRLAEKQPENLTQAERYDIFKLYMVYAIASTLISLSEKYEYTPPQQFYVTAIQHVAAACETRSTQNIEAMILLVIYHLRSATSHGLWYMIGLAMRTCIDLGLHRKSTTARMEPYTAQLRRRLFWTVYYLERAIALSLGRPFSISDRHIDVELPLDVFERNSDTNHSPSSRSSQQTNARAMDLSLFCATVRIRQIESKIQHTIYRADKPLQELRPKIDRLYRLLEEWKASVVLRFPRDLDYAMMHYNRTVRLLIQPFLPLLPLTDPYYHICLRASGEICQAHKKLHQTLEYGHSFLAVQTVFVSGITMLYALWANTDKVWSIQISNDIRACSTVLFVLTERAPWVKRYRDTFELLVNATMEKLQGNEAAKTSGMVGMMAAQGYGDNFNNRADINNHQYGEKQRNFGCTPASTVMAGSAVMPSSSSESAGLPEFASSSWQAEQQQPLQHQQAQMQFDFDISEEAMRMAMELAPWIDQETGGEGAITSPLWMPDFDTLQNLTGPYQF